MGCDNTSQIKKGHDASFQSTHPVWDATTAARCCRGAAQDFNPRIPYGMRLIFSSRESETAAFQSTHPVWDATSQCRQPRSRMAFQSTHPVWDATSTSLVTCAFCWTFQSTHPVWDATVTDVIFDRVRAISIHASRMGCDDIL